MSTEGYYCRIKLDYEFIQFLTSLDFALPITTRSLQGPLILTISLPLK